MSVLTDSSVWIEYFRSGRDFEKVDFLIDENVIVTNDLILTELVPFLRVRKQRKLIGLMYELNRLAVNVDWEELATLQYKCLLNGLNGVGIPDLIIVQNAMQHTSTIYSLDKHFARMANFLDFELFS